MVLRQGYTKFIDIWTIGIFAYEMSNYNPPFAGAQIKDRQRVKKIVIKAQKDRVWKNPNISDELNNEIKNLKFSNNEKDENNSLLQKNQVNYIFFNY